MTAEIVNLRKARKIKARAEKERQAAESRALHGRTKVERIRDAQSKSRVERELDGARREPASEDGSDGGN